MELVNLKLVIEYDGKNYFGWQRQAKRQKGIPSKPTIQQAIEESLQVLFKGEKIQLIGAGRTDAGVHALNQAAHFKLSKKSAAKYSGRNGLNKLSYSLNAILPSNIVVKRISRVSNDFHARYSARERIYRYFLTTQRHAVGSDKMHLVKTRFDVDLAKEFCKLLTGYRSFKSLCKNQNDDYDFKCDVKYAKIVKMKEGIIKFEISASRFLHSMVRAVVGAMISAASGKMSLKEFQNKFNKGEKIKSQYVPANALFLVKVKY